MLDFVSEIGERVAKFVLAFSIFYAIVSAAVVGSGLASLDPNSPLYAWAQWWAPRGQISMTNEASGLYNVSYVQYIMAVFTFLFTLVTAFLQIALSLLPLLPQPLQPPLLAAAIVLQAIASSYIVYRLYIFVKTLFSSVVLWGGR
jgi:hypothetical protein